MKTLQQFLRYSCQKYADLYPEFLKILGVYMKLSEYFSLNTLEKNSGKLHIYIFRIF